MGETQDKAIPPINYPDSHELGFRAFEHGQTLLDAGSIAEAIGAFKRAAENGVAQAYVQLAFVEIQRENRRAAGDYMRQAEALAEKGDALANLSCSLGYQMAYGDESVDEQERKARHFLREAARLGLPTAQLMLAQQFLWGLNDDVQDEQQYHVWIWRAIDQGLDDAVITHVKNLLELRRVIEPRVLMKLQALATRSEEAKKLLRKVSSSGE